MALCDTMFLWPDPWPVGVSVPIRPITIAIAFLVVRGIASGMILLFISMLPDRNFRILFSKAAEKRAPLHATSMLLAFRD